MFFDKVKSLGIDSYLYEIPKNDLVDDMKLWPPVTYPDVYCYVIETPGDFTWKKLKAYNFVIFGWVKPLQVLKRNSGYDSHDPTSPLFFPTSSFDFCPSPILTRVWGYHDEKIVELKMFVGTFWQFNALNYFPLKQKGKFPRQIS